MRNPRALHAVGALLAPLLAIACLVIPVDQAWACSCLPDTDEGYFRRSAVVFVGTALERQAPIDESSSFADVRWTFGVEAVAKGNVGTREVVKSPVSSASCGITFTIGRQYQVYAGRDDAGELVSYLCSGTRPLSPGYRIASADGNVRGFGATAFGDVADRRLAAPIVGIASTTPSTGYWLAASDGGVFAFGSTPFRGSLGNIRLNQPIIGIATTQDGGGYWLVGADGGVFAFGSAGYFGSTGGIRLQRPVVGMAASPDGKGYWLVGADGGIFAFGSARFFGSAAASATGRPVVGIAATPTGKGYWMTTADGEVLPFGDATHLGDLMGSKLSRPITAIASMTTGSGYWLVGADGGIFAFGNAPFLGSNTSGPSMPAWGPVVGITR